MTPENKKLVIFDFDGVLVNTINFCFDIHKTVNRGLTWERFQDFSNGNFIETIRGAEKDKKHIIINDFYDRYQNEIEKININDKLHELIVSLSSSYILSIVSSTPGNVIKTFLIKEKLGNYFPDILGADVHTNKTIKINSLLEKYNISNNDSVFITDSLGDILEANKCGVKSIGVTWGIHQKQTLIKGNPVVIVDNPNNLLGTIKNVLK